MTELTLYFAQHGLALDKTVDPDRPLSETGKEQSKNIAGLLHDKAVPVNQIFHSGKLRAAQTANIFATVLNPDSVTTFDFLSPNEDVKQTAEKLTPNNALYVGHLPHLEKLIAYLVTGDENNNIIKFRNSAIACLQKTDDSCQLRWYLTPELTE